ncbi:MAG: hypothetical protein WCR72_13810 [Bacteroidota bacterium]
MKTLRLIIFGMALLVAGSLRAQVNVTLHLGSPPQWGPVGYSGVRYYYLPDVEAYYDVNASMFIYQSGGVWIHRTYLPTRYRNYDLYGGYKVVLNDYHGNAPYSNFKDHRRNYAKGYHGLEQHNIGERPGRGNSRPALQPQGRYYKQPAHENVKNRGNGNKMKSNNGRAPGNGKEMKKDNGHRNDNGKKK